MNTTIDRPIEEAKNIGTTIAKRLNEIEIYSLADLAETTAASAYKKMSQQNPEKHLPLCYYLYSLQGALLGLHWDEIPKELKSELRKQIESSSNCCKSIH